MENIKILCDRQDIVFIADTVRNKTGSSQELTLGDIAASIYGIETGVELPTLTNEGAATDLLSGKQLIDSDGNIVEGTIATKTASNLTVSGATVTVPAGYYASQATKSVATATQATPSITVDSAGKITASATQTAGYITAGTKTATKQLTTQAAKTVTPTKSSQTAVAKDVYTTGVVTVAAIPSQYITTTDATAAAGEIFSGETAYVNGSKVTGTFTIDSELTAQDNLISQIQTALQNKTSATGEDVTAEINAYTTKLATLETAITALETELQGKASGGSGGGSVETCTVTITTTHHPILAYGVAKYVDGAFACEADKGYGEQEFTFDNVVRGSCLTVTSLDFDGDGVIVTNCTLKYSAIDDISGMSTLFYMVNG